jgi:hypothetical protein
MWRGYMASQLSAVQLLGFALLTFAIADTNIKSKLIGFLMSDSAGSYLINAYLKYFFPTPSEEPGNNVGQLQALPTDAARKLPSVVSDTKPTPTTDVVKREVANVR